MKRATVRPDGPISSRRRGFTVIELLVVITIIIIVTAASGLYFTDIMQSRGMRESARLVEQAFDRARQQAANQYIPVYIIFHNDEDLAGGTGVMFIVEEIDGVEGPDFDLSSRSAGGDRLVETIEMPDRIEFDLGGDDSPPLFQGISPYWIKFGQDGSIIGASAAPDNPTYALEEQNTWRDTGEAPENPEEDADLVLKRESGDVITERVFMDWDPLMGRIMKTYYDSG